MKTSPLNAYNFLQLEPKSSLSFSEAKSFRAQHPMFRYEAEALSTEVRDAVCMAKEIVVIGLGGSILPLKSLFELHPLFSQVFFLDTVDPDFVAATLDQLEDPLFCVVSKSGETLEIKLLLAEVLKKFKSPKILAVTDPEKGQLREQVRKNKWMSLPIPPDIGGRFTHFTVFHRALAERFGISFEDLLTEARERCASFKKDASFLQQMFDLLFESGVKHHVIWHYGENRRGMAEWMQQVLAESLGKLSSNGKRQGILPTVLAGPQHQHSVLQLLRDGPTENVIWFLGPASKSTADDLSYGLWALMESTHRSFKERLIDPKLAQSLIKSEVQSIRDTVGLIVSLQCFVEYAADRLEVNAYDQPGVERGKEIARELWAQRPH